MKSTKKTIEKPSAEAKALSLFLMAHKSKNPTYKDRARRINKLWDLVVKEELSRDDYFKEVQNMLASYGGYEEVIEKTIRFYIKTTGEWKVQGDDKYSRDAKVIEAKVLGK